jgi:fused signal recognition particle receptor
MFKKLLERFDRMVGRGVIDDDLYDELEEGLLLADAPVKVAHEILEELRRAVREERITDPADMRERLKQAIASRFAQDHFALEYSPVPPTVYLFVGVNGVGKTTTIAKVAAFLRRQGFGVMMAAGDTFRAAAIEQLEVWAERTGAQIVKSRPGSDSGAVIFDAIQAAKARGIDFVLADTAGRQHSKGSLMTELQKVVRTAEKALGRKPDEVLLVLDANTGQNALRQAEEFSQAAAVTGLVLTKVDGTARGGALLGIYDRFKIPIKLVGVGERAEDLQDFRPERFARQLFE